MDNNEPTTIHEGTTNWSDALVESARPELYRMNTFRVTGLPVDATVRDISRRVEKLRMMERLASAEGIVGALPLDPPPSPDAIREAMQRLRDPERRLVDEFFWFWPHKLGQSNNDNALVALACNDVKTAREIWTKLENYQSDANVSMHNLAVLCHAIALDMEYSYKTKPPTNAEKQVLDQQWREALKRWKTLLEHEGFWSRLSARIRELDDPRLTTGAARRMRTSLPLSILMINAQLALRAAERSDSETTKRHIQLMNLWDDKGTFSATKSQYVCRNCGKPVEKQRNGQWWCSSCLKNVRAVESVSQSFPSLVNEALRRTLKPVCDRIKTFCKMANEECNADESKGGEITQRLLDQTKPLLAAIDCILPVGNTMRDSIHDEITLCALGCEISYVNKTSQWKIFNDTLQRLLSIVAGGAARVRIQENLKIGEGSIEYAMCYFCSENVPDEEASIEVKMHGNVVQEYEQVGWQYLTISVPRCTRCKALHDKVESASTVGGVIGGLAGFGGCISIVNSNGDAWFGGVIVLVLGIIIGSAIGKYIAEQKLPANIKPKSTHQRFVKIQYMLKQGWSFGEKPPNVQQ